MHTKFTLILTICYSFFNVKSQTPQFVPASVNSFGEILYAHPGSVLTSGKILKNSSGFLMAGHVPGTQSPNFFIDRTGNGGAFPANDPAVFQRSYSVFTGFSCLAPGNQPTNCSGITAIETFIPANPQNGNPSLHYAVAGSLDNGCFFSFLAANGTPVSSFFINFALIQNVPFISSVSKPLILEASSSLTGSNEYYICGTYDITVPIINTSISIFYAHRVTSQGVIVWSREYLCMAGGYMCANDMIESSINQNLVVVGQNLNSGLLINLDRNTGGGLFSSALLYNAKNYPCSFSSIVNSNIMSGTGTGYVIGGENRQMIANSGGMWFLKVNGNGGLNWNTLVRPSADFKARNVKGLVERRNWNGTYEYYGVTTSTAGAMVVKLNQTGIPAPQQANEFVYNAGTTGNASSGQCISFADLTGANEGLHIFGNNTANAPSSHYMVQAYFSGHAGCNTPDRVNSYDRPEVLIQETGLIDLNLPLVHCSAISIVSTPLLAYNPVCGPVSALLPPANNARMAAGMAQTAETESFSWNVYPNPVRDKARITADAEGEAKLVLYNSLGQHIHTQTASTLQNGVEMDFAALDLESGIYFLSCYVNGQVNQQKVVYTK